jgi:hypothetical protein
MCFRRGYSGKQSAHKKHDTWVMYHTYWVKSYDQA